MTTAPDAPPTRSGYYRAVILTQAELLEKAATTVPIPLLDGVPDPDAVRQHLAYLRAARAGRALADPASEPRAAAGPPRATDRPSVTRWDPSPRACR